MPEFSGSGGPVSFAACKEASMSVLELCDAEVAKVSLQASVADSIRTMLDLHVGAVAVVDDAGRVAGIFTERDVLRKFSLSGRNPDITPVRELMTTPVELATTETSSSERSEEHT